MESVQLFESKEDKRNRRIVLLARKDMKENKKKGLKRETVSENCRKESNEMKRIKPSEITERGLNLNGLPRTIKEAINQSFNHLHFKHIPN